jgi:hypothetical protein
MAERNRMVCATLMVLLVLPFSALAGPAFPLLNGVTSRNGNSMVIIEYHYEKRNGEIKRIQAVTFRIARKQQFVSFPHLFTSPSTYWSEAWSVTRPSDIGVPLPLVTDDGQFLILLTNSAPYSRDFLVMNIYRENRETHTAEVVGACRLSDVWPAGKLPLEPAIVTDHSPRWFDSGSFDFASGYLIHKTRWGNAVQIKLISKGTSNNCPLSSRW